MDVREKLVDLVRHAIFELEHGDASEWIADYIISNGVKVLECGHWEDEHGDYVCSCCHTVFTDDLVWLVRGESNEPNYCPNCGAKMMPQPPKGETIYCKDCENLMFSDCYGECANGHKGIVNPNDTCEHAKRKPPKGE